jgi:MFS family permease
MTASYAIGTLVGSLPGGVLAVRAGPKFTVCVGLALLACSTVAFALLHNAALLDAARFVDGVGGACSWAGGLAWIVAETPADQRGAMIGRALGAAIGGALFGPVIGTVATATGRPAAFGVLVLAALLLIPPPHDSRPIMSSPSRAFATSRAHCADRVWRSACGSLRCPRWPRGCATSLDAAPA